ncbi:protein kinase domain-containing protein [Nannocystaceae bacterium ST9]
MTDLRATEHVGAGASMADPTEDLTDDEVAELGRVRAKMGFIELTAAQPRLIAGRYEIIETIGYGGMGKVHRVYDRKLKDSNVALKLVRGRRVRDLGRLQEMLELEAEAMARLRSHPHVVGLFDVGAHQGCSYFTMQYVDGSDLRSWCEEHGRAREQILRLYLGAGRGLKAAHDIGVVHRDFKPDNVLVTREGVAKVADFGIAEISRELESPELAETLGARGGTRAYMPPELLLHHERADKRADQFAFCISVWESLCGQRPFSWRTPEEQSMALDGAPRGGSELPRWLRRGLLRGMAKERTARFDDMGELLALLERGLGRPQRLKRAGLASGGGTVIAAVAVITVLALRTDPLPPQTCDAFVAAIEEHWGPSQHRALEARRVEAPESIDYALMELDRLGLEWATAARDTCEGDVAPEPGTRSRGCFERWLVGLDQAIELLSERGDQATLRRSPDLLQSLVPPGGDYCALPNQSIEDPELRELVESARIAGFMGDDELANERSALALVRAEQLAGDSEYTFALALAHATRGEVLHRGGQFEQAIVEYRSAEIHGLGASNFESLAWTWILWGKGLSMTGDEAKAREAEIMLERTEPLFVVGALPTASLLRGELIEATALTRERLGRFDEAVEGYQRSAVFFIDIGYPLQAARSLLNRGVLEFTRGDLPMAEAAEREALILLEAAKVPQTFPYLLQVEFNLGLVLLEQFHATEDESLAGQSGREALVFLQRVIDHAPSALRVEALSVAAQTAIELGSNEQARAYADRALVELDSSDLTPSTADEVRVKVGLSLVLLEDRRGEAIVRALLDRRSSLEVALYWALTRSWIEFLENTERCIEARAELERLDGLDEIEEYREWRADRSVADCR